MGVADKAATFLAGLQGQAAPAIQQLNQFAQKSGEQIANTVATSFGQVHNQMQNMAPMGQMALGYGAMGAGLLGAAALAGSLRPGKQQQRLAGQYLGAQLGVPMPPQY